MGFWTGMANATKDRADRNERQDARDQDQAQRDKMFDYAKAQDDLAMKRLTEQDAIRAEGLAYDRTNAETAADRADIVFQQGQDDRSVAQSQLLADLYGTSVSSGTGRAGTSGSSTGVTSVEAMRTSGILLRDRLDTEIPQMTEDQKAFYEPFLNDPKGAHGLMTWVKSQVDDNKNLGMADIPDLIHMVGLVEGKGQQAYTDMTEKLKNGFGVNNPEEMIEALNVARAYTADTLVWGVKREAPTQLGQADVYNQFTTEMGMAASSFMSANKDQPTDKSIKVGRLYGVLKNGSSTEAMVNDAMFKLYDLGIGQQEALALQGQSNIIDKYFLGRDSTPVVMSNEEVLATILSNPTISDDEKRNAQSEFDALNGVSSGVSSGVTSPPAMGEPTRGGPGFDTGTPLRSDLGGLLPEQITAIDSAILDNPELESVASSLGVGESTKEALGSLLSYIPRLGTVAGSAAVGGSGYVLKGLSQVQGFIAGLTDDGLRAAGAGALNKQGQGLLDQGNDMFFNGFFQGLDQGEPDAQDSIDRQELIDRMNSNSRPLDTLMLLSSSNKNTNPAVLRELIGDFDKRHGEGAAQAEIDRESASTQSSMGSLINTSTQPQSDAGKVAQQNLDNAATMSTAMSSVTEEEYEDLTRIQRRELGLPESNKDLMFAKQEGGSFGVTPEERARTDALRDTMRSTPAPEGMGESFPNESTGIQDRSLIDSQDLYDILESDMPQDVIDEAIIAFEKDYGAGSARAAYEMITSRQ